MLELGSDVKVIALVHRNAKGEIRKDGIFNPAHCPFLMSELKKAAASGCPIVMGHNTHTLARKYFDRKGDWRIFFPRTVIWSTSDVLVRMAENAGDARNILVERDAVLAAQKAAVWAELFGKDRIYLIGGVDLFEQISHMVDEEISYTDKV